MSTAIIRAEERCFRFISKGDKELGSLMLISADKGRADISWWLCLAMHYAI
jgi:hypothetical protein